MGLEKNLSDALGIDHETPPAPKQEVITYEPPQERSDAEEDYRLARKVLRNLIEKGNDAIEEISQIARQQESARGFEVVSTLIKTVGDTTKDLYNLQKITRELNSPESGSDPRKKNIDNNISVENAVFVGSAAELLSAIKKKKEEDGPPSV